ncbi:MAG: hypothetical protein AAB403_00295, partial [Planctomycetota bacterium]
MSLRTSIVLWAAAFVCLLSLAGSAWAAANSDATEGFETHDFSKFPWSNSGDASWVITRVKGHSGRYCAKSGSIGDGQSTTLHVTLDCAAGTITFYRRISCEPGYDSLRFYIDGVEQDSWSGQE